MQQAVERLPEPLDAGAVQGEQVRDVQPAREHPGTAREDHRPDTLLRSTQHRVAQAGEQLGDQGVGRRTVQAQLADRSVVGGDDHLFPFPGQSKPRALAITK